MISFIGVVVDHIENDFDPCLVQGFHHVAKFVDMPAGITVDAIALMWCEIPHRAVAPVVHKGAAIMNLGHVRVVEAADG